MKEGDYVHHFIHGICILNRIITLDTGQYISEIQPLDWPYPIFVWYKLKTPKIRRLTKKEHLKLKLSGFPN